MREGTFRHTGIRVLMILAIGMLAVAVQAQQTPPVTTEADMATSSTATVTLTDSGMQISPEKPGPGPVQLTVTNNSSRPRGLVITGEDRANTPIIRYSELLSPGRSTTVDFWFYLGQSYTLRDFTSRHITGGESSFRSTYSSTIQYPAPAGYGRGPSFPRQEVGITLTNSGIDIGEINGGPTSFVVRNQSSRTRGMVITGEDRAGSPIIRYSRLLRPGQSTRVNFWLYGGQNYTVRDYTSRRTVGGEMMFNTTFSESFTAPAIPLPPRFGAGTTNRTESGMDDDMQQ